MNKYLIEDLRRLDLDKISDIHIKFEENIWIRKNGRLESTNIYVDLKKLESYLGSILDEREREKLSLGQDIDKAIELDGFRYRCNVFLSNSQASIAMRIVDKKLIDLENLDIYEDLLELIEDLSGLILITGKSGSGKTMTMNSIVDYINREHSYNILTIEDPIEYLHKSKNSLINQREVGRDIETYEEGLKSSLREDPDIIILGEMRSLETIEIALTAAETGHLVISTLHTMGGSKTIDRVIDVFPESQQSQIRLQLSTVLRAVFSQELIEYKEGRKASFDKLIVNHAIKNLIRENKTYQIDNIYRLV